MFRRSSYARVISIKRIFAFLVIFPIVFSQFFILAGIKNKALAATELIYGQSWMVNVSNSNVGLVVVDSSNNLYLAGDFSGTGDLDISSGTYYVSASGSDDTFISKYSSSGVRQWVRKWGGNGTYANSDELTAIAVDDDGNLFAAGYFIDETNVDFDGTSGTDLHSSGDRSHYITKYNTDGTYGWTRTIEAAQRPHDLVADSAGAIYMIGEFDGSNIDFDGTAGTDLHSANSTRAIYITKYNSNGTYGWTRTLNTIATNQYPWPDGVDIDSSGNVFFAGFFGSAMDFDPVGTEIITPNGTDLFVTSYDSSGNYLDTFSFGSASSGVRPNDMILDSNDNIYITGRFFSTGGLDFDNSGGTDIRTTGSDYDFFVTKYLANGDYAWTRTVTAAGEQYGEALVEDSVGNIYVTGNFRGTNIDIDGTAGTDLRTSTNVNANDSFISKYASDGSYIWSYTLNNYRYSDLALDSNSNLYSATELIRSNVDFDFTSGTDLRSPVSGSSVVLSKYSDVMAVAISGVNASLKVEDKQTTRDASVESPYIYGANRVIKLKDSSNKPIAEVETDMTNNRDWSGASVTGEVDIDNSKSVVTNLTNAEGTSLTHTLYIPRLSEQSGVYICPDAANLTEVTDSCSNGYLLTLGDANVSLTTEGGQEYWLVSGLSGTGGLGIQGNTPTMRVVLANESTSATDDVEVWFATPTDITADSLIYIIYETVFTGGSAITTSDVTVYCDEDGLEGGTSTGMTTAIVASSESGYLEIDTNSDTCTNWIKLDIHGGGGNHLTNPGSPGNYSFGVLTDVGGDGTDDDSGATLAYVANDNDVNITAIIPPTIDLELFQAGTDVELTDSNSCLLGVLSLNQVNTCIYDVGTGTNNQSGLSVYMTGDGDLDDGNGNIIGTPTGAVTSGEAEYGFYLSDLGGGEFTAAGSYNTQHQAVPTSATLIASTSDTGSGTTVGSSAQHLEVTHAASMSTSTVVGSYNQLITFTAYTN